MELKTFLQDVETGHASCPAGIGDRFFAGVVSRLRDAARDAVAGASINSIDTIRNALRKYFAPRKTYTHYCAEIQGIRMRRNETVMEYYNRVKRLMESAKTSLPETFEADQIPDMQIMLEGIALEPFKRGLSDEFIYALRVQEPATLTAAVTIARQLEIDMHGNEERKGHVNFVEGPQRADDYEQRHVRFRSPSDQWNQRRARERYDSPSQSFEPRRFNSPFRSRETSPYRENSPQNDVKFLIQHFYCDIMKVRP